MTDSNSLKVGGVVTFWSIGEWTSRATLNDNLTHLGLDKFCPGPRTNGACLRDALEEMFPERGHMVRPLKSQDGFAVVEESRGRDENAYSHVCTAKIAESKTIALSPYSYGRLELLVEKFNQQLGLLRAGQVSGALVKYLDSIGATALRPSGAIYWLPGEKASRWSEVAHAVEASGYGKRHSVYLIRHAMDADAVRAVRDAIVAEVLSESRRIHAEIISGELGEKALLKRADEACSLRAKIEHYEELLGVGLGHLKEAVSSAEEGITAANILAASSPSEVA